VFESGDVERMKKTSHEMKNKNKMNRDEGERNKGRKTNHLFSHFLFYIIYFLHIQP